MSNPGPSRQRLSKEAAAFLTNYASAVNSYPQWAEKQSILLAIHAIPGNEWYTIEKLSSWFARNRHPTSARRQSSALPFPLTSVLADEETVLFPKLTPMHLQQLRVLYKKRTDPAENIITFWAERIKADRDEVVAWLQYQQEKAKEDHCCQATPDSPDVPLRQLAGDLNGSEGCASPTMPTYPHAHLPTPSPSEPSHERMPSLPPIAVKVEEPRQCLSPVSPLAPHSFDGLRKTSSTSFRVGAQLSRDSIQSFATTVRESLRNNSTLDDPPPRTPDEFAAKFATFEKMIDNLTQKHTSGELARLGWDPNICSTGS